MRRLTAAYGLDVPVHVNVSASRLVRPDLHAAIDSALRIEEALKWCQPAYLTRESRTGSTIRIDSRKADPQTYAMYFRCQTDLIRRFRTVPEEVCLRGQSAIVFHENDEVPVRSWKSAARPP
jgi:hypothetical protein